MRDPEVTTAAALTPDQDRVINSGSWGAAIFTWIYLIAMRAYPHAVIVFLLSFIPLVQFVIWIYCMVIGKRLAWTKRTWRGFDDFLACQRIWDKWAKWFFGIGLVMFALAILLFFAHSDFWTNPL